MGRKSRRNFAEKGGRCVGNEIRKRGEMKGCVFLGTACVYRSFIF